MEKELFQVVAQWGAWWFLVIFTAWMLVPRIADYITVVTGSRRREAETREEIERVREERK